ncbi:MAG: hypothetical protein AUJ82_03115 [Verrucomicrobia bacterium CG1_02_43_26]|nr:MAG: hypothetical protein AUJ82_03115 [Verrucomicrobia bacterium CG1_02_43_26]
MTQPNHTPHLWQPVGETVHSECRIYSVYCRRYQHPVRKSEDDFYVLKFSDWVLALPLTEDKQIILVNQFRFGSDVLSWELPGGTLDEGESPSQGVVRELLEETGYAGDAPLHIGSCSPNPALQDNKSHCYLVRNCTYMQAPNWDHNEELEIRLFPLEEAFEMALDGRIHHTLSITSLFFLKEYLQKNPL